MKRGFVAAALAAPLALVPGVALATGSSTGTTTTRNTVTIKQYADFDTAGFQLDIGLTVTCKKGTVGRGLVDVTVQQYPPETPHVVTAGVGDQAVVCDGKPHSVAVHLIGAGYDAGRAKATATLFPDVGGGSGVTVTKWITIVAV